MSQTPTPGPPEGIGERLWVVITSAAFLGLLIFSLSLIGTGVLIYAVVKTITPASSEFGLPVLALLSVLLLLGALLIFTTLIHVIGLSDKNNALGLPDGSVRALLALALLGLFAILVSSVLVRPADKIDEFAKQMLTLVGTLMTAVISFYFGSTTVASSTGQLQAPAAQAAGTGPAGPAAANPAAVSPTTARTATSQTYKVAGTGLGGVTRVEALPPGGGSPVAAANVRAADAEVAFDLSLPTAGAWTIQVASGSAPPVAVPGAIEVTGP